MSKLFSEYWNNSSLRPDADALIFPRHITSWAELKELVGSSSHQLRSLGRNRIGLHFTPSACSYAIFLACQSLPVDVFLLDGSLCESRCLELAGDLRLRAVVFPAPVPGGRLLEVRELSGADAWSSEKTVTILTSGSTGKPKAARHSWESLLRPVRRNQQSAPRWLLTYRPHLYAGIQVTLQCLIEFGALAIPDPAWSPTEITRFVADSNIQYISATPSYWRRLLLFSSREVCQRMNLRQITLGGEVVDQPILDALKASFPNARLVHIYATTELGRCFSVSDGMAGFPRQFLEAPSPGDAILKIQDGELFACSPSAMNCYDAGDSADRRTSDWVATGDLVSLEGDRVYFSGRKTEMINVGGNKVYPLEVERVVRNVPGVADVRVYGRSSSLSGQLVSCEIVSAADAEDESVKRNVQQACSVGLAPHQRPRFITIVDRIELSPAYKTIRSVCS